MPVFQPQITRRRGSILAVCTAAFLVAVAPVQARGQTPQLGASAIDQYLESVPPTPSIEQYVEDVPTSSGPSVPGVGKETRTPLPPATKGSLEQASPSTGSALETVAGSSTYGAPKHGRTRPTNVGPDSLDVTSTTSVSATLRSSVGALGTATDARLLGLLLVVFVTTVGVIALATRRGPS